MGEQSLRKLAHRKVERLLVGDPWSRAMLAKLRRGVGKHPGELPELFEIILGDMPEEFYGRGEPSYSEWAIYTTVTLFALHQQGKDHSMNAGGAENDYKGNSFGAAVGCLVKQDRDNEPGIKRRFDAAITSNEFTEFAHHARGIIQLLRAADITLNYPHFAEDLFWYQYDSKKDQVRLRWGEDYYWASRSNSDNEKGGEKNAE